MDIVHLTNSDLSECMLIEMANLCGKRLDIITYNLNFYKATAYDEHELSDPEIKKSSYFFVRERTSPTFQFFIC